MLATSPHSHAQVSFPASVKLRRFYLLRHADVSGVSGTGIVAEGVRFSNGVVTLHWLREPGAIAVYNTIGDLLAIHGHDGSTEVRWVDENN